MSELKQRVIEMITEQIKQSALTGSGTVISYDQEMNFCDIMYSHPKGHDMVLEQVPVRLSEGLSTPHLNSGAQVSMIFPEGNIFQAFVVAIIDVNYMNSTRAKMRHKRKGSFVPDQISSRGDF